MRHLHLEPIGGVSGDMLLSLMVDLGFNSEVLSEILSSVSGKKIKVEFEDINYGFLKGKKLKEKDVFKEPFIKRKEDLREVLKNLKVPSEIKEELKELFNKLFEGEEEIHGKKHNFLHEIGSLDTFLDLLGFLIAKKELNISSFSAGPVPMGNGFINTSHGLLSLPAPLTALFLKNFIVIPQKGNGETVTPTGALILNQFFKPVAEPPPFLFERIGYGFGQRKTKDYPNMLKGYLGEILKKEEEIFEIKFNLDDSTGQMAGNLMEKLFQYGAKDVIFYPATMKKSRPAIVVEVLCYEKEFEKIKEVVFKESTTLGIRYKKMERVVLEREIIKIKTEFGELSLKIGKWKGNPVQASFEYEELKRVSEEKGIPLKEIFWKLSPVINNILKKEQD